MAATMQGENFGDLAMVSHNEYHKGEIVDLTAAIRDYKIAAMILQKTKRRLKKGPQVSFNAIVNDNEAARDRAVTDKDQVVRKDGVIRATVPFRYWETSSAMYREEELLNGGSNRINNLKNIVAFQAQVALFKHVNTSFFTLPTEGDVRKAYTLPYWVPKSATASTSTTFQGITPVGYSGTTVAGINPTTYTRWRSYAGPYTNPTFADLVKKIRQMQAFTKWEPPVPAPDKALDMGMDRKMYTNYTVMSAMIDVADSKNDNHGNDVDRYNGSIRVGRTDLECVAELDADTTGPVYQIDWSTFFLIGLEGLWGYLYEWQKVPGQSNLSQSIWHWGYQYICYNRSKNGVLSTGTTYP